MKDKGGALKIICSTSLALTLDGLNEAFFTGRKLSKEERVEAASWIAARHGLPNSYANMFAPTQKDFVEGIKVYTGERVKPKGATSHILGEEASRALNILKVQDKEVREALDEATRGIQARLEEQSYKSGMYCCGICTSSLWRHAVVGKLRDKEMLLKTGIRTLKRYRRDDGKWGRFPFYYTLLALSEIDLPEVIGEIKYAVPVLEKMLRRKASADKYSIRRHALAERVLEKI